MARQFGVTLISRAKGRHYPVLNGAENLVYDAIDKTRKIRQEAVRE